MELKPTFLSHILLVFCYVDIVRENLVISCDPERSSSAILRGDHGSELGRVEGGMPKRVEIYGALAKGSSTTLLRFSTLSSFRSQHLL